MIISTSERNFLNFERFAASLSSTCIHEMITAQALENADAIAVSCGDRQLTYGELDDESTRLAGTLRARGVSRGTLVGLVVDRSPDMVVALLAILKAGGAYVPLDPSYPPARLTSMLSLSGARLVISETKVLARLTLELNTQTLLLDRWKAEQPKDVPAPFTGCVASEDTAYVIFTSGSTGQPKGVEIVHGALVNLCQSLKARPGITAQDTILAVTSISFDIAAAELLLPLSVGARVEIATSEDAADPLRLLARLEACGATVLQATPVTWRLLMGAGWTGNRNLRVWCGGEEMSKSLASELLRRCSAVWNLYGPTETTVWSAVCRITPELASTFPGAGMPLGVPLANTSLYVLDEHQQPVAPGASGELYIGGIGLAKGYWMRPDLTEQSFLNMTLPEGRTQRVYRTGDRVRLHPERSPDESLEFLGRMDRQVKLRGFRIELGEVEQAAGSYAGVQEVVITKVEDGERGEFLAAYVVSAAGQAVDAAGLRAHIAERLPGYMVPSTLRLLERLPVTPNGKVDRKQLPPPNEQERVSSEAETAPLNELEGRLAMLWKESLRLPTIGRDDNYFDLGGDSLLAAQLVARMARIFDRPCNFASLLQSPTIASYAVFLTGGRLANFILLAEGSAEKRNQTIFWMDNPDKLHHLAALLEDQPFYSMLLGAEDLSAEAPDYALERLAARMVRQILQQQSEGQFYIGGFCQHALLAYEVGQQLRAEGHEVPLLIMVDAEDASIGAIDKRMLAGAVRRVQRERFHLSTMFKRPVAEWIPYLQRRFEGIRWVLDERKWQRTARAGTIAQRPARELTEALFVSRLTYVPRPYAGRVLFIEATVRPARDKQGAMREWNSLVADAIWRHVQGEHLGLFAFPVVHTLADELCRVLESAA